MRIPLKILEKISLPIVILVFWWYATEHGGVSIAILASPKAVFSVYLQDVSGHRIFGELWVSLSRVLKGYFISATLGIFAGSLLAISKKASNIFLPTLTAIRQVPIIALIPLFILWAGIGEEQKVLIIVFASFFPIMMNTLGAISETPESYIEVAQLYRLSKAATFRLVYLPNALPGIFTGLQLGLGVSWMSVVAAEIISSNKGIGYYLNESRTYMNTDTMIACLLLIAIVGAIMNYGLSFLFNTFTPWKTREPKKIRPIHVEKGGGDEQNVATLHIPM